MPTVQGQVRWERGQERKGGNRGGAGEAVGKGWGQKCRGWGEKWGQGFSMGKNTGDKALHGPFRMRAVSLCHNFPHAPL